MNFINNAYNFFYWLFDFTQYVFTVLLYSPLTFLPYLNILEYLLLHQGYVLSWDAMGKYCGNLLNGGKLYPHIDPFNMLNKSKSGGLMPGHRIWSNSFPTHIYLANWPQPFPGAGLQSAWLSPSSSLTFFLSRAFCIFLLNSYMNMIVHCCPTYSTLNSICQDESSMIIIKDYASFDYDH